MVWVPAAVAAAAWISAVGSGDREVLFDDDWRFFRGDDSTPPPPCPASTFPVKVGQCYGLTRNSARTVESCRAACCARTSCTTWQFGGPKAGGYDGVCFLGDMWKLKCKNSSEPEEWQTGGRRVAPSPALPPPPFADPEFDDSEWRTVDTPHDWAIEDLPAREDDLAVPAVSIRNGTWRFHAGDGNFSASDLDDSNWVTVMVPHDWRDPPTSYTTNNAIGWYRRNFTLTKERLAAFSTAPVDPVLALGVVACSDETWVNGARIGGTSDEVKNAERGHAETRQGTSCTAYRAYKLDLSSLRVGSNSVAVRVASPGGNAGATYPSATPGGLCDTGANARNGVSVASGADWTSPSPFDAARAIATGESGRSVGYSTNGVGWYRKKFNVSMDGNCFYQVLFDGVYDVSDMWLNGQHLGTHPYGYTPFAYNLTTFLHSDKPNVLAVRIQTLGSTSRWYSGSGIFRHVRLIKTPAVRVALWGLSVSTPRVAPDRSMATALVTTTVENQAESLAPAVKVVLSIADPRGNVVAIATHTAPALSGYDSVQVVFDTVSINGSSPNSTVELWTIDNPSLYTATISVGQDVYTTSFGIRTLSFTSQGGFLLNGVETTFKGGCVHHDNGALGSATIDRAEWRRVALLKANGYNAIRTSHNPVSPAFLDACDRLGVLVMHEAFDCWEWGKGDSDYHLYFDDWWQRDITAMVKSSTNHPSIVMWSIGNEIPMRESPAGFSFAKKLANLVRELDPSDRAITSAVPMVRDADDPFFAALDVGGYNYSPRRYASDHHRFPERIMVGTESFPMASFTMWDAYTTMPWVLGDFIWTAIDYIGESAIGSAATTPDLQASFSQPWQWHISFCGDLDIMGMQKPQAFYRQILWDTLPIAMLVHHAETSGSTEHISGWGWPDERDSWTWSNVQHGTPMQVRVFSKCSNKSVPSASDPNGEISLTLNGVHVDGSPQPCGYSTQFIATFTVPYYPGKLEARCSNLGQATTSTILTTAGKATGLKATADRYTIAASRNDLAYVTVEVVDAAGQRVADSRERLKLEVSGTTALEAVGTGDPTDVDSFRSGRRVSYQGRIVAILRPMKAGVTGNGTLKIFAMDNVGIASTSIDISVVANL